MACHFSIKLSEAIYFALKIVSQRKQAYESNFEQTSYSSKRHPWDSYTRKFKPLKTSVSDFEYITITQVELLAFKFLSARKNAEEYVTEVAKEKEKEKEKKRTLCTC